MKKLRMIVTSVVVLAIVASAFSFKLKVGTYCVLTGTTAGNCTTFLHDFKITTAVNGVSYRYYPCWDTGNPALCTQDTHGSCTAQIKLVAD